MIRVAQGEAMMEGPKMTLDIYGHYIPKTSTRRGVDVLDERAEKNG